MRPFLKLAIASAVLCSMPAVARWNPSYGSQPPEVQAWYKDQHNAQGQWCCDEADGHPYYGVYTINRDGSVSIQAPDGMHTLPSYMVLKGPNPTGHAVWWYLDVNGQHSDYCFAPGTLT